ncbi:MAG TPA: hypothetical protein VM142_04790 [Acidimicrobiales bacterium]|nr:hypothetical protein [Acidimicrobiales bacterium]
MRLLLAGNDITVIAPWLGHEQIAKITWDIYQHVTPTMQSEACRDRRRLHLRHSRPARMAVHLPTEMSTPRPEPTPNESLELPVDELLRRGRPHLPYGEQVIDDLTSEEAEAFLDAILS